MIEITIPAWSYWLICGLIAIDIVLGTVSIWLKIRLDRAIARRDKLIAAKTAALKDT